jgi:hypothetical protein
MVGTGNKPALIPLVPGTARTVDQLAARHAHPSHTTIDDRRRENFDRHAAYIVVAVVAWAPGQFAAMA